MDAINPSVTGFGDPFAKRLSSSGAVIFPSFHTVCMVGCKSGLRKRMYRLSCYALIALGALHLLALGVDAIGYTPGWFRGDLWTFEHWAGVADQRPALVFSGFAFWSTFGSIAPALIALGYLLLWMDDRGLAPPRPLIAGIIGWALIGTLLMPPSGLPAVFLVSLGLLRRWRKPASSL